MRCGCHKEFHIGRTSRGLGRAERLDEPFESRGRHEQERTSGRVAFGSKAMWNVSWQERETSRAKNPGLAFAEEAKLTFEHVEHFVFPMMNVIGRAKTSGCDLLDQASPSSSLCPTGTLPNLVAEEPLGRGIFQRAQKGGDRRHNRGFHGVPEVLSIRIRITRRLQGIRIDGAVGRGASPDRER